MQCMWPFKRRRGLVVRESSARLTPVLIEAMEARRLLSAVQEVDSLEVQYTYGGNDPPIVVTAPPSENAWPLVHVGPTVGPVQEITVAPTPAGNGPEVPNVKRTYAGSYSDGTGLDTALTLKIRKQDTRGSLRGTLTIASSQYPTLTANITYGKVQANTRVRITAQGTVGSVPFTATILAKSSTSGSQIKGDFSISSSIVNTAGKFVIRKS